MDERQNQDVPKMSSVEEEEFEMSHADKLVGVFSEPGKTFEKMSKFPAKTSDWLIPLLIMIVVTILSLSVMQSNPDIRLAMKEKQLKAMEQQFDEMVKKGQITEAQKEEQLNTMQDRMDQMGSLQIVFQSIGVIIFSFIIFFVVVGVFYLFVKYVAKGDGTYRYAMAAYGLPMYITVLQSIVAVIVSLAMNKMIMDVNAATLLNIDSSTITGFLLSKLAPFSIWFYILLAIGFAKLFKSTDTKKYIILIFGIWIGFSLIFFFLAKALPFLRWFTGNA